MHYIISVSLQPSHVNEIFMISPRLHMNELRLRGLTQISAVSLVRQTQEEGQVF